MTVGTFFVIGVTIGLMTSIPVGPVNILVITRTLRRGFLSGLTTGLGGMTADTLIAVVAAFGITAVIDFVEGNEAVIQVAGGLLLVVFGIAAIRSHPHLSDARDVKGGMAGGIAAAFAMTVANPGALLGMLAIFGGLGDLEIADDDVASRMTIVAGVAAGATGWWIVLSTLVSRMRTIVTDRVLSLINEVSGLVLIGAGIALVVAIALGIRL